MKTTFALFLVVILSVSALAQKNYLAKDLGYTSDVKMVEEVHYRYNPKIKKGIYTTQPPSRQTDPSKSARIDGIMSDTGGRR